MDLKQFGIRAAIEYSGGFVRTADNSVNAKAILYSFLPNGFRVVSKRTVYMTVLFETALLLDDCGAAPPHNAGFWDVPKAVFHYPHLDNCIFKPKK